MKTTTTTNDMLVVEPLHIDVTAFDGNNNDPILEKELEEIALNGRRSGLISGTPEKDAYDIENGKPKGWRRKKDASTKKKNQILWKRGGRKSIANFDDDDADKSGHGAETLAKDNTTTLKQRMMMLTKHKIW